MITEFIPQFTKMLNNLSAMLDKAQVFAETKKFEPTALLQARLAPDQWDFTRQVQATCDMATAFAAKLSGTALPKFEDNEKSLGDLQTRIQNTLHFLHSVSASDFEGWEKRQITNPRREGKYLPANEFAMQQAIPNFYFHMTTAYAILRNCGMDVGKKDFLGALNYRDL